VKGTKVLGGPFKNRAQKKLVGPTTPGNISSDKSGLGPDGDTAAEGYDWKLRFHRSSAVSLPARLSSILMVAGKLVKWGGIAAKSANYDGKKGSRSGRASLGERCGGEFTILRGLSARVLAGCLAF
jgi:hypothetical protein